MEITEIKAIRKTLGLTQQDLANVLGVVLSTVQKWEGGETRPSRLALRQLNRLSKKVNHVNKENHN